MDKLNALISVRERTEKEAYERLLKADFTEDEAHEAVESAVRCGLVSNERYASAFIRGKQHAGWGKAKIVARLRANGVPENVIDASSDLFADPQEERDAALRELRRRPTRSSNPYASLVRRLVGKGYPYALATSVVKEFLASEQV